MEPVPITTRAELDLAFDESARAPVLVFKHSLACASSFFARRTFDRFVKELEPGTVPCFLIEVQPSRDISDELARRSGVQHHTPQVILLRDGRAVWDASHWEITDKALRKALEKARG